MADYEVRRSTTINAQPAQVYDKIANFRNWESWSPWEGMDPSMKRTYGQPESGVGSSYSWTGNRKVGEGSMEITDAVEPSRVAIDLRFLKPFKSSSETVFVLEPVDGGTMVTWIMTGDHTAMSRIFSFFMSMDKTVGKDFDKGLAQLKAAVES